MSKELDPQDQNWVLHEKYMSKLYHILSTPAQRVCLPPTLPISHNYYGTAVSGKTTIGYNIQFDSLASEENVVLVSRNKLTFVTEGSQEPVYDKPPDITIDQQNVGMQDRIDSFCTM